ncbi:MAG: peptidoglycan DD-metalloendopeptidase family protein [Alphaproteobacteria bacterium]
MAISNSKKGFFGRFRATLFGRLFCKRSIIIISEHKTQHVPFSGSLQALMVLAAFGFIAWGSYSTGSYMAAQQVLKEKDKKIAFTQLENERVGAEFALLKRDLSKLAEDGKQGKLDDYAQMVAEQYNNDQKVEISEGMAASKTVDYNAVFERIDFLEARMRSLQETHEQMMADIHDATDGKIKEIEEVIAQTGMNRNELLRKAEADAQQKADQQEKYGRIGDGRGGPYEPARESLLKEKDTELYFNLKRLMTLSDIVESMPLATPVLSEYRQTSGFGTRVDPFHGRLAFHSGLDMAAPLGTKIHAATDGRVTFTGWKGAYGNTIDLEHGFGFGTRYGHLSKILVKQGQAVKKGQVIAIQGSTGRSTGLHLHYEVRYNDKPVNPKNFLKAGVNAQLVE